MPNRVIRVSTRNPLVVAALLLIVAALVVLVLAVGTVALVAGAAVAGVGLLARRRLSLGRPAAPRLDPSREVFAAGDDARRLPAGEDR